MLISLDVSHNVIGLGMSWAKIDPKTYERRAFSYQLASSRHIIIANASYIRSLSVFLSSFLQVLTTWIAFPLCVQVLAPPLQYLDADD